MEFHGCLGNGRFNNEHSLRCTKSAESRVGRQICFAAIKCCLDIRNIIGIGCMEKRSVRNGRTQIVGGTAILEIGDFVSQYL